MPLNKLDNFLKNVEGRILYVSPSDLDSTDSITNEGNSQTRPFKTLQRALIEAARFSYNIGNNNDAIEKTTILLMPGEHLIDNRPGYGIKNDNGAKGIQPDGTVVNPAIFDLTLESNFDLTQENNILYKFNSIHGGVIVPRGVSIVGLDLRKTKIRPKYVPNPTNNTPKSAIFRITGGCYFWQFSIFDGDGNDKVYTNNSDFLSQVNLTKPTFSHHKLTCFEYADGVNKWDRSGITDLDMYYHKLSVAYNSASTKNIANKYPAEPDGFKSRRAEYEIVGAFSPDSIQLTNVQAGENGVPSNKVTVTTLTDHNLEVGTPIKIQNVDPPAYNISTKVATISATNPKVFTYTLPSYDIELTTPASNITTAIATVETDTVDGSSPYIFNCSLRSVYGMQGMNADGSKATGFRSMVVAQFTGISLQKDDRAFVKYSESNRGYSPASVDASFGSTLALQSSSTNPNTAYHLDSDAIYRSGWETAHITISNDAILQIVSVFAIGYNKHFTAESGGDASITNSNSNFGQLALVADGFKKNAFEKDDKAYLTHIITPKAISSTEDDIDWISIDTNTTATDKLYLYGFDEEDVKPPSLTQGYRIGAKLNDKLYVKIDNSTYEAPILMVNHGGTSTLASVKEYSISAPISNTFTTTGNHQLSTGEKVILRSGDGDLPENIANNIVYYVIKISNTEIKLASSKTNADANEAISTYGGTNLKVLSRVTDKSSGDIGHPIQYDDQTHNQWYLQTSTGASNTIYGQLAALSSVLRTEPSFVKRTADTRNLDDKIYKLRISIPQEASNSKNPESGFIIQESSTTGIRTDGDFTKTDTLTRDDFAYNRNLRYISSCTYDATGTKLVTISADKPHNLNVGDIVTIKNVTTTDNTVGAANSGYNGEFTVHTIINSSEFKYNPNKSLQTSVTNNFNVRNSSLPRFERTDLKSNIYLYRNEIFEEYDDNKDGVYHGYPLNASVSVTEEFTGYNYSQNVTDLYPQLDRDNVDDNPRASKTFALRSPLGKVVTNDLKNSVTRESVDKLIKKVGLGYPVSSVTPVSVGVATVTFSTNHTMGGLIDGAILSTNSNFNTGTYYNVKLYTSETTQDDTTWNGTRATVVVDGTGKVTSCSITEPGSGWNMAFDQYAWFDKSVIGISGSGGRLQQETTGVGYLTSPKYFTAYSDRVIQFTGDGSIADSYFRISNVVSKNQVTIAAASGDTLPSASQYGFIVDRSLVATTVTDANGLTTFTSSAHDLQTGSKFQANNITNNEKIGTFIVKEKDNNSPASKFTAQTGWAAGSSVAYLLKHGLDSNNAISEKNDENISTRGVKLFDNITALTQSSMTVNSSTVQFSIAGIDNLNKLFTYGSYIQIDNEIMRIATSTVTGAGNDELAVVRGLFGTIISSHDNSSAIKKIKPIPLEFHRPSILRASGHTFEYLGYGPGNYSTSLPQVQVKTLTEEEEFLSQSQERGAGAVVYTGMNNKGDFYVGNQKQSALTGENKSYDVPVPTIAGEDPGRLSVVYDEVLIKERLVVEGGKSNTALTEFEGPVTFSNEIQVKDERTNITGASPLLKINSKQASTSSGSGALVVTGGVGIGGTVNIGTGSSIRLPDDSKILLGTDNDLELYHKSTTDKSIIASSKTISLASTTVDVDVSSTNIGKFTSDGLKITGVCTATSFDGIVNASIISGIITTSKLGGGTYSADTYLNGHGKFITIDTSAIKDSNGTVRAQATTTGVVVTGILTATSINASGITTIKTGGNIESNKSIFGFNNTKNSGSIVFKCKDASGTAKEILTLNNTHVDVDGELRVTGDIIGYYSTSDERLKDNITPIEDPLAKVLSISGNTFNWNSKSKWEGKGDTGVIAQEVETLKLPDVTTIRDDGTHAVRYEKLIPLLIEAVKELSVKVEVLEQKLSDK